MALLVVLAVLVLFAVSIYNRLVRLRNQADESWSGIDVQLKRRYDLIPNLVESVKGYAAHEQGTLQKVVEARNSALTNASASVEQRAQTENALSGALTKVFALAEQYPDLKANQNFIQLQGSLVEVEDNIQNARRYYNAVVRDLNTAVETFPAVLVANSFGFTKRQYFEISAPERENVAVKF